jgi:hypothetical protein
MASRGRPKAELVLTEEERGWCGGRHTRSVSSRYSFGELDPPCATH